MLFIALVFVVMCREETGGDEAEENRASSNGGRSKIQLKLPSGGPFVVSRPNGGLEDVDAWE